MNRRGFTLAIAAALNGLMIVAPRAAWTQERPDPLETLESPTVREPFSWIEPIRQLWARGDRLQAAFWYYIYQLRSRPWADADHDGGGAAALRASVAAGLGREINEWIGSDPAAWRDTGARAIAYEKTLPLHDGRPDGVSEDDWLEANRKARQAYEDGFNQMWAEYSPSDIEAQRRQRGLYVGPLKDAGRPLRW